MMIVRGCMIAALAACGAAATPAAQSPTPTPAPAPVAGQAQAAPAVAAAATPAAAPAAHDHDHEHGHKHDDGLAGVIDQPAPPWQVSQWFNSPPLTLDQLHGKVVLVRWFMGPSCPFCSGTAPTLRALDERYADKGLVVVGMYHHKEETPLDPKQVEGWVKHFGYRFPVAIDKDWTTLRKWWLDGHNRAYTSASFLIDKAGVVRRVHLGGLIAPDGDDAKAIATDVERLLAQ